MPREPYPPREDPVPTADPTEDVEADEADLFDIEAAKQLIDESADHRRWLKALLPLLQLRPDESAGRTHADLVLVITAAADRACRILRSDLREG